MRSKQSFRKGPSKQEGARQKLPTDSLDCLNFASLRGNIMPTHPSLILFIFRWTESLFLETAQDRLSFSKMDFIRNKGKRKFTRYKDTKAQKQMATKWYCKMISV